MQGKLCEVDFPCPTFETEKEVMRPRRSAANSPCPTYETEEEGDAAKEECARARRDCIGEDPVRGEHSDSAELHGRAERGRGVSSKGKMSLC